MAFKIVTPLIDLTKAQIIQRGVSLGVDYSLTVSCYQADADGRACGSCDSCRLRRAGFRVRRRAGPDAVFSMNFRASLGMMRAPSGGPA